MTKEVNPTQIVVSQREFIMWPGIEDLDTTALTLFQSQSCEEFAVRAGT